MTVRRTLAALRRFNGRLAKLGRRRLPDNQQKEIEAERIVSAIIEIESGGDPRTFTPGSSALGLGQFVPETWLTMIRRHQPELLQTLSREELLDMRTEPSLSREMVKALLLENTGVLGAAGIQPTPANLYLSHFLGLAGALRVFRADPETAVSTLLSARAIENNRTVLDGKSVRDVVAWAERNMGIAMLHASEGGVRAASGKGVDPFPAFWPPS